MSISAGRLSAGPTPGRRQSTAPDVQSVVADPAELADRIRAMCRSGDRVIVGIVGAPGSGKSTLSAAVLAELAAGNSPTSAALVPMDGYHLAQRVLEEAGLAEVKGAPATFDAAGYVALLHRLIAGHGNPGEVVYAPEFRRDLEEPIAGAVPVTPDVQVVITEGNYLLADEPPWIRWPPCSRRRGTSTYRRTYGWSAWYPGISPSAGRRKPLGSEP